MTIPEVPPVPNPPEDPDVPDQPTTSLNGASTSQDDRAGVALIDTATREEDERDALRAGGLDRAPTVEEEIAAEEAERQIDSELGSIAEHQQEMTRLGAKVEGE